MKRGPWRKWEFTHGHVGPESAQLFFRAGNAPEADRLLENTVRRHDAVHLKAPCAPPE